jgi:ferric-dicitrate binding protein FerR (iron transport regulator)
MDKSKKFRELLKRYQAGTLSEDERQAVDAWIEQRQQANPYDQLTEQEQNVLREEMHAYINRKIDHRERTVSFPLQWLKAAAAITVLAVAFVLLWQWKTIGIVHIQTFAETQKVILPDGSIIWLKENSSLDYPGKFNSDTRTVSFTGEALFEIAKNKDHPFVIQSGALTATVLGTSFNIKSSDSAIQVNVLTGQVSLAVQGRQPVIVSANEKAVYASAATAIAKTALPEADVLRITSGTEYTMSFEAASLAHIVKRVESKFNVTITLSDAALGNCRITADLTDQSLVLTLDKISEILGSTYVIDEHEVRLSGEGCK